MDGNPHRTFPQIHPKGLRFLKPLHMPFQPRGDAPGKTHRAFAQDSSPQNIPWLG